MRPHLTLFFGIFCVMALSNAIVPVLASYGADSSINGLIYAAYFLGAFVTTLPSGILSDRHGPLPVVRAGLAITVISGLTLALATEPLMVTALRFIEGLGAGLFVAAAMSWVNSSPDHIRMSGWLMASMNAGLVLGLLLSGGIGAAFHASTGGILLFAIMAVVPAILSLRLRLVAPPGLNRNGQFIHFVQQYGWLFYSAVVLIGITGVLTSLYPHHSQAPSDILGIWIAGMSIATIAAVIIFSRTTVQPVPAIRVSATLLAGGVIVAFFIPLGLLIVGAVAGVVMIAQMAFLAGETGHQGIVMGLFATTSYLGMALLPAAAGFLAGWMGYFAAFGACVLAALSVAVTIGRCSSIQGGKCGGQ